MATAVCMNNVSKIYRTGIIDSGYLWREIHRFFRKSSKQQEDDRVTALDRVSMSVEAGESIGVVGRNGSGKSTLLKLLGGVTLPTAGEIELRGRVVSLLDIGTGFSGDLSARENIFLNGAILGMHRREIIDRFEPIVEFSGIGRFLDTPVKRFSSGMYIRLGFSIAIHCAADIMLIDEVLAAADRRFLEQCRTKLKERVAEGIALVVVSHNLHTIRDLCSRVVLLEKGAVAADGATAAVLARYRSGRQAGSIVAAASPPGAAAPS